jgi:hypothetical protein
MLNTSKLKGSCLCGKIHYEVDGELGPIVCCHCARCRKSNGAAFATNSPINARDFRLTTGEEYLKGFDAGVGVERMFCGNCGSPLFSKRAAMPEIYRLRIGTLDTKIDARPSFHIYVGSKAEWYDIHDNYPQHEERA